MCATTSKRKNPPHLSNPYPYLLQLSSIEVAVVPLRKTGSQPPNFGFPTISPGSSTYPSRLSVSVPPEPSIPSHTENTPLLRLPLEILHQILLQILVMHPVTHKHLVPPQSQASSPETTIIQFSPPHFLHVPGHSLPKSSILSFDATQTLSVPPHPQYYHTGKIPTALLRTCKRLYTTSRVLPFHTSPFTFTNIYHSGLSPARLFTRSLRDWQSDALRFVSLEVLAARDLLPRRYACSSRRRGKGTRREGCETEWEELCNLWKGVWGLKLGLMGSMAVPAYVPVLNSEGVQIFTGVSTCFRPEEVAVAALMAGPSGAGSPSGDEVNDSSDVDSRRYITTTAETNLLDINSDWIVKGLCNMSSLRWIQIEIEDTTVSMSEKEAFCLQLEILLNCEVKRSGAMRSEKDGDRIADAREGRADVRVVLVNACKL